MVEEERGEENEEERERKSESMPMSSTVPTSRTLIKLLTIQLWTRHLVSRFERPTRMLRSKRRKRKSPTKEFFHPINWFLIKAYFRLSSRKTVCPRKTRWNDCEAVEEEEEEREEK